MATHTCFDVPAWMLVGAVRQLDYSECLHSIPAGPPCRARLDLVPQLFPTWWWMPRPGGVPLVRLTTPAGVVLVRGVWSRPFLGGFQNLQKNCRKNRSFSTIFMTIWYDFFYFFFVEISTILVEIVEKYELL